MIQKLWNKIIEIEIGARRLENDIPQEFYRGFILKQVKEHAIDAAHIDKHPQQMIGDPKGNMIKPVSYYPVAHYIKSIPCPVKIAGEWISGFQGLMYC